MISRPPVDVVIPEQLAASYGLYIWPCAPVLAWYIWLHQVRFKDCHKKVKVFILVVAHNTKYSKII